MQDAPDFVLDTHWTLFDSPWNPFEKGTKGKSYKLTSFSDGTLFERPNIFNVKLLANGWFSTIMYTDYETFYVQYYCQRAWLDFYTKEYVDVYVREGVTLAPATLT